MKKLLLFLTFPFVTVLYSQTPGNALNFDGSNDMVVCSAPPLFNDLTANDFTFEAWVYPTGALFSRIIFAQPSTTNFATMSTGGTNNIYFYVIAGGTTYSKATTATLPSNQWTHVACRWTAATLTPDVFFNGVLQASSAGGGSSTGTNGLMTIGTRPGGAQYFPGSLDDIRVWSEARTQCEIQSNMNAEFIGVQPTLVAYYNCNQGVAGGSNLGITSLADINGTYNGTLNNFALTGGTSNWIASGAVINVVGPASFGSTVTSTICSGDSYIFGGQSLSSTGTFLDTIPNIGGCDSIITLNLTVLNPLNSSLNVSTCDQYMFNSMLLTSSGTYNDTLVGTNGCDSVVTLNLDLHFSENNNISATACDQYSFNSMLLNSSGTYTDTLPTINGCDSIITLTLTINNSQTNTISQIACDEYLFNGSLLTASGTYYDTLSTLNGCDSIVMLQLTINNVNTGVNQTGTVLAASAVGAIYQWLDCNNNFAIIAGETNAIFNTIANGNYAVQITENGCLDTSACFSINTFGIDNNSETVVRFYPNPTDGILNIQLGGLVLPETIELMNINGQCLQTIRINSQMLQMDLGIYPSGIYFLKINGSSGGKVYRVIRK